MRRRALAALASLLLLPATSAAAPRVLDGFENTSAWSAVPASGVLMKLSSEPGAVGRALRVDFDFQKGGGYAVIHRKLDVALPANYRLAVRVRGATAPQNFELKLIDASGENVWWRNRRDFVFPAAWQTVATRKRQIEFAWGPKGGGELERLAAMEFAITAGSGGKGTVWLDELTLEELPLPSATPPPIVASGAAMRGFDAARAVDGDSTTGWRPATGATALTLDLGTERELGGLTVSWNPEARVHDYRVEVASEPGRFRPIRTVRDARAARDGLYLPETEARWIRIVPLRSSARPELREVTLEPLEFGSSLNRFLETIAKRSPRGWYPRAMRGEPQLWSVIGEAGGAEESFLSEDGAVDLGISKPSIEPFLWTGGRLWSWADVEARPSLPRAPLPHPRVTWIGAPVELNVEARRTDDRLAATYELINRSPHRQMGRLLLALRPFQVNPPAQFLNTPGGACRIDSLRGRLGAVEMDDARITPEPAAAAMGFATLDQGDLFPAMARGAVPSRLAVVDPEGLASGALGWDFDLRPGDRREFRVTVDWPRSGAVPAIARRADADPGPARVSLPPSESDLARTLAMQIQWIEINRDGPAIQPGSRAYARSWIRDGALTCSALLRWGKRDEVKQFLEWFAPFQYADGKVPCCVDRRGSDPVPEHDSHGELIYLAAEYYRHSGDRATVEKLWPHVAAAVAYQDTLRAQRLGAEWRDPSKREFFGIFPPSISHEGYSAKPMHSYWDDLWGLRGYKDAAFLARTLGRETDARRIDASLAAFSRDFAASIRAAQAKHRIAFIPGCADLGDFDATSTTMALSPVQADGVADPAALRATFERYWSFFTARRDGKEKWDAFTPYEIRNIGAFIRLGWRDRAQELTRWFMTQRSPAGWAQWAEVVHNDPKTAKFLGDIPHTWVGSDFVRSILDAFAYERERDDALVIGAGVPASWIREAPGVRVENVSTWHGPLSLAMTAKGRGMEVRVGGVRVPKGGLVIAAPGVTSRWRATVNGRPARVGTAGELIVRESPATIVLTP